MNVDDSMREISPITLNFNLSNDSPIDVLFYILILLE